MKILILENDPTVRLDLEETVLSVWPNATVSASDGPADMDDPTRFDIVLLDSEDGSDLACRYRGHGTRTIFTNSTHPTATLDDRGRYRIRRPFAAEDVTMAIKSIYCGC